MKSEMRSSCLVAVVAVADEHAAALRRFRKPRPHTGLQPGKLCVDQRHGSAIGGHVHRAWQGVDPSALRQLPSGRRSPRQGERGPAAPAAGRRAARTATACRRCAARSATSMRTSNPAACRAIRNGISRRAKWRGRARRSARSARRSRIPRAMAAASCEELIHHIGEDTLVGWAWAPGCGPQPRPGTQKQAGALVEAWVKTGAACPAQ